MLTMRMDRINTHKCSFLCCCATNSFQICRSPTLKRNQSIFRFYEILSAGAKRVSGLGWYWARKKMQTIFNQTDCESLLISAWISAIVAEPLSNANANTVVEVRLTYKYPCSTEMNIYEPCTVPVYTEHSICRSHVLAVANKYISVFFLSLSNWRPFFFSSFDAVRKWFVPLYASCNVIADVVASRNKRRTNRRKKNAFVFK